MGLFAEVTNHLGAAPVEALSQLDAVHASRSVLRTGPVSLHGNENVQCVGSGTRLALEAGPQIQVSRHIPSGNLLPEGAKYTLETTITLPTELRISARLT